MNGWKTESMGQHGRVFSDRSVQNAYKKLLLLAPTCDTILDVGCYEGDAYEILSNMTKLKYTGIDIFQTFINKAKFKYPEGNFLMEDVFNLTNSADIVFCCRVLMHIPDFELAVSNLIKAANKYCVLVIPIEDEESMVIEEGLVNKGETVYFRKFSQRHVEEVLHGHNFTIERYKPYSVVTVIK